MSLFVLDSDILSLLQKGEPTVTSNVARHSTQQIAISVITIEEQLRGWYTLLRRAKGTKQIAFAYAQLAASVAELSHTRILPFTESAIETFDQLRKAKLGVRGNDLRIAAIALEHQAAVVTRNVRDFQFVPGLKVEDWSKP